VPGGAAFLPSPIWEEAERLTLHWIPFALSLVASRAWRVGGLRARAETNMQGQ
jgi:hypothetical protein